MKNKIMSTISMSLCMLTNMFEKYHSFFILIWVNHGVNQKKKINIRQNYKEEGLVKSW